MVGDELVEVLAHLALEHVPDGAVHVLLLHVSVETRQGGERLAVLPVTETRYPHTDVLVVAVH